MAGEFRTRPLAEGLVIPSQIGTGEAQVFQPVTPQEIDIAGAFEKRFAREEAQRKGDVDLLEKLFKDQKILPGHTAIFGKMLNEAKQLYAANISEIRSSPFKKIEHDKKIYEIHNIGKISAATLELQKDITEKQAAGEKYSEEDLQTLKELGEEAKELDLPSVAALYEKIRNIVPLPDPVDVLSYQSEIRNLVDVELQQLAPTVDKMGNIIYQEGMNEKEYRRRYDAESDVAWTSDPQIMQEYPADSKTPEGEPFSQKWRDTMYRTRTIPKLKKIIRAPIKEKKKGKGLQFIFSGNRATNKKWNLVYDVTERKTPTDWKTEAPYLPSNIIESLNIREKVAEGKKVERIRIQGISTGTENKPHFLKINRAGEESLLIPIAWEKIEGEEWTLVTARKVGIGADATYEIRTIPADVSDADIEAITGISRLEYLKKLGKGTQKKVSKYTGQKFKRASGDIITYDDLKGYSDEQIEKYIKNNQITIL